jgi:hypothetical protein
MQPAPSLQYQEKPATGLYPMKKLLFHAVPHPVFLRPIYCHLLSVWYPVMSAIMKERIECFLALLPQFYLLINSLCLKKHLHVSAFIPKLLSL